MSILNHASAHIPDEAVQAMPERVFLGCANDDNEHAVWTESDEGGTEYIRADISAFHLSAPCAVEVVKLEWRDNNNDDYWRCDHDEKFSINRWWEGALYYFEVGENADDRYHTIEEAKAAAQADFERRILSCVVTKPVDVASVERQVLPNIERFDSVAPSESIGCYDGSGHWVELGTVAAIRTLSPAEPARSGQWQPIETAPKDGTRFLAALTNGWIVILSEMGHERYAWYQTSSKIHIPVARTHPRDSLKESILATHWMPLPAAPTTEAGK